MDIETTTAVATKATLVAPPQSPRSGGAETIKFLIVAALFTPGLIASILFADRRIGDHLKKTGQLGGLGQEVRIAVRNVNRAGGDVKIVFLGDSVAHQLFEPGTEGRADVLFLPTNQAVSVAGQCYLAESAMKHCPALSDIYLLYMPGSWGNNLPRDLTHDYFCGYFHTRDQVIEVWNVKRDVELSVAHAGRWLMPNLMAANSLSRPAFALAAEARAPSAASVEVPASPPDPERLITAFSNILSPAPYPAPATPPGQVATTLSPVSHYYLGKLRLDCLRRGIRLHLLPCPVSDETNGTKFVDPLGVYDFPVVGDVPANQLIDGVHFKRPYVQAARNRMIREYGLTFLQNGG
jgi:hypothetical protein